MPPKSAEPATPKGPGAQETPQTPQEVFQSAIKLPMSPQNRDILLSVRDTLMTGMRSTTPIADRISLAHGAQKALEVVVDRAGLSEYFQDNIPALPGLGEASPTKQRVERMAAQQTKAAAKEGEASKAAEKRGVAKTAAKAGQTSEDSDRATENFLDDETIDDDVQSEPGAKKGKDSFDIEKSTLLTTRLRERKTAPREPSPTPDALTFVFLPRLGGATTKAQLQEALDKYRAWIEKREWDGKVIDKTMRQHLVESLFRDMIGKSGVDGCISIINHYSKSVKEGELDPKVVNALDNELRDTPGLPSQIRHLMYSVKTVVLMEATTSRAVREFQLNVERYKLYENYQAIIQGADDDTSELGAFVRSLMGPNPIKGKTRPSYVIDWMTTKLQLGKTQTTTKILTAGRIVYQLVRGLGRGVLLLVSKDIVARFARLAPTTAIPRLLSKFIELVPGFGSVSDELSEHIVGPILLASTLKPAGLKSTHNRDLTEIVNIFESLGRIEEGSSAMDVDG